MSQRNKILIIDDSEINRELLSGLLEEEGDVVCAENGRQGVILAISAQPDLILLDVIMPGMNGYEVCASLKANRQTKEIPVIFLTAKDSNEEQEEGLLMGAVDYITKPFSPVVVKLRVGIHLKLKLYRDRLMKLSMLDGLTGISNRRHLDQAIAVENQKGIAQGAGVGLLMIDIDLFKQYNDSYGHLAGDECLKRVAQVLSRQLQRKTDIVARYGGEEFVVLLTDCDRHGTISVAKKMIKAMAMENIEHRASAVASHVTLSIGVIYVFPTAEEPLVKLISQADQALYKAKMNGRNRCEIV